MIIPKKLAIYYGYPSMINGSLTVQDAIQHFLNYDIVVLGAGLENSSHPDYTKTKSIITSSQTSNILFFGYVDCTRTMSQLNSSITNFKNMGMDGIFCDRFGYDFGTTRSKQNNIINSIHNKGLKAFANSWNPDDTFGNYYHQKYNPNQIAPVINNTDWYLIQSYQIINGEYQDPVFWQVRSTTVNEYKTSFGTNIACVTTYSNDPFDQNKADYSYYSSVLYNFDAWGWGELYYSASDNLLPYRTRKPIIGTDFCSYPVVNQNGVFSRQTNVGICINTNDHITSQLLDC